MNREKYLSEVEKRLSRLFNASKEGYKVPPVERHRLEGFMNAGVFMGFVSNAELNNLMNETHLSIFDKTIQQRKIESSGNWQQDVIDYSSYEQPSFTRKK